MKTWLTILSALGFLAFNVVAYGEGDNRAPADENSTTVADEMRGVDSSQNDLVFDSADVTAPVFSKSDETFRAPTSPSLADRERATFGK